MKRITGFTVFLSLSIVSASAMADTAADQLLNTALRNTGNLQDGKLDKSAVATTISSPGSDLKVPSEKAARSAINLLVPKTTTVNGHGLSGNVTVNKADVGLGNVDNTSDAAKPISTATQAALDGKVTGNVAITGATKTKITYDAKGLVTAGADATTADIADSTNKRYVSDAQLVVIGNTSGTNTGDVTIGTANGLSLSGQQISLQIATDSVPGALTAADHATFAAKAATALEAITAPALLNSWTNVGGGEQPAQYYKDNFGIVHVEGLLSTSGTSSATVAFNLPVGYRPASNRYFSGFVDGSSLGSGNIGVTPAGDVYVFYPAGAGSVGIEFSFRP
ncbi:hypothetical protein [Geobacter sp. SVR]|uniref:hypothetical protein n=1 Tax=Geobacter sp. SVR TaxID=2495594 RepID=UPI00143EFAB0|nr:hypothetical protein [Geobacter sp. SVR]BCS54789.1 hypothetical protein GSVR_30970 [Geobacter sp. SVR]GCF86403.1 hypothetical protein GSbR_30030 [Geobacter sp. SVR]